EEQRPDLDRPSRAADRRAGADEAAQGGEQGREPAVAVAQVHRGGEVEPVPAHLAGRLDRSGFAEQELGEGQRVHAHVEQGSAASSAARATSAWVPIGVPMYTTSTPSSANSASCEPCQRGTPCSVAKASAAAAVREATATRSTFSVRCRSPTVVRLIPPVPT